jgi:hypothetical protein
VRRSRTAGATLALLIVTTACACATRARVADAPAELRGVWRGHVWETPSWFLQGVRPVTMTIGDNGTWTAVSDGGLCASGVVSPRNGLIVLDGNTGDLCVPYTLKVRHGVMWGAFDTSFKGREASGVIELKGTGDAPTGATATPR